MEGPKARANPDVGLAMLAVFWGWGWWDSDWGLGVGLSARCFPWAVPGVGDPEKPGLTPSSLCLRSKDRERTASAARALGGVSWTEKPRAGNSASKGWPEAAAGVGEVVVGGPWASASSAVPLQDSRPH